MAPTAELRWAPRWENTGGDVMQVLVLQQKWVQHHIPAGMTEAPFEWRAVPVVEEAAHG